MQYFEKRRATGNKGTVTDGCSWDFITLASCSHQYLSLTLTILSFFVIFLSFQANTGIAS